MTASPSFSLEKDPLKIVDKWLQEAIEKKVQRHPNSMVLATISDTKQPSTRVVLLKSLSLNKGFGVFYTHYGSRKSIEIKSNPFVSAVLHWDQLGKQIRFEGKAIRSPVKESDEYFVNRPWKSQLNAWVSEQSQPQADPSELIARAKQKAKDLSLPDPTKNNKDISESEIFSISRPPFWGGYRFWFAAIELWEEGPDRFHIRRRFERSLSPLDAFTFKTGPWKSWYLQP
ncbi:MAG: hypothetical protein CMM56_10130 [Rhodospirillaceae bacterium]|nr:hypothetical protein [Rhodospirillaceae bacterium]|tara:strand:- start:293 stop:979 length:687 start_codon:yes stop_codon:yes gene_type:complete